MFKYQIKVLKGSSERQIFKKNYELVSGLLLPDVYLHSSQVFGLVRNGQIIGGFILNNVLPLRTYKIFANEINWDKITSRIGPLNVCEICCFWLEKKYWSWIMTSYLWFNAALIVSRRKEDMIIFGTVSKGNMVLYQSTLHSKLLHLDLVDICGNKKNSWIYGIPVKWFFIDINWGIMMRFYNHVLKLSNKSNLKYLKKQLGLK